MIPFDKGNRLTHFDFAAENPASGNSSDIGIVVKHCDKHLKRKIRVRNRRQHSMQYCIEQGF